MTPEELDRLAETHSDSGYVTLHEYHSLAAALREAWAERDRAVEHVISAAFQSANEIARLKVRIAELEAKEG